MIRRAWIPNIVLTLGAVGSLVVGQVASATKTEWVAYGGDNRGQKYSHLSAINANNAKDLKILWRWASPDNAIAKARPGLYPSHFKGTPLMVDGNLYVSTSLHQAASIDARTGRTRWIYDPGIYQRGTPQRLGFVHRGLASWQGRVFLATGEAYLIALDMETGEPIQEFGQGGRIDLLAGIRRPVKRFEFGNNSPPIIVRDVLIAGSFVQDGWRHQQGPPGDVRGYDPGTGKLLWTFHTVPKAGEVGVETWLEDSWRYTGSSNVWTWMSGDEELGLVYLPTSTPANDHYGGHRPGDNLFAESIVCLDVRTGRRVWHFQTTHHGVWDYDLPAPPVLADITVEGRPRKVLAQVSKQAFLYVLDRETGKPIWDIEERPVPQSGVPGEQLSPTQPFPTRPPAFDRQGLTPEDLIDFTPQLRAEALEILSQYNWGGLYTPPSQRWSVFLPGIVGGASWSGAAFDPDSSWLYVPSITSPWTFRLVRPEPGTSDMNFLTERAPLDGPDELPITKPPYGRLTAIDLKTGEQRWTIALGQGPRDHPRLRDLKLPALGWPARSFVLATQTVLFAAQELPDKSFPQARAEPYLWIIDKSSGETIAEVELPTHARGAPMTYSLDSRQFVVVPVGGAGRPAELVALGLRAPAAP